MLNETALNRKNAVKDLEHSLKKLENTSYRSIDRLMRHIMKERSVTAKELHNDFVHKHNKTPDDWIKELKEETKSGDQGLHDWFNKSKSSDGTKGWVQLGGKYAGKPCARQPGQTSTPKCGSSKMKKDLSKKEEDRAFRRKNRQDPNQPEKTGAAKPTNVRTEEMNLYEAKDKPGKGSGKKDACYHKVKSRFKVWPSAYASGALVKCRKVGADNWGTHTEEMKMVRFCPKCYKNETRDECKYGPKYWDMFSVPINLGSTLTANQLKYNIATVHPGNFYEAANPAQQAAIAINMKKKGKKPKNMEEMKCWKGYKKAGKQVKDGRVVNKCVPIKESLFNKISKTISNDPVGSVGDEPRNSPANTDSTAAPQHNRGKKTFEQFMLEALDKSSMKCNSPRPFPTGDSETGKSHVVKACEGGKEKIIHFGQRGVKGSPKKEGESEAYRNRRLRFKARHAKNIAKGKMSAAYWSNKWKW